jgi:hypothetical protein
MDCHRPRNSGSCHDSRRRDTGCDPGLPGAANSLNGMWRPHPRSTDLLTGLQRVSVLEVEIEMEMDDLSDRRLTVHVTTKPIAHGV